MHHLIVLTSICALAMVASACGGTENGNVPTPPASDAGMDASDIDGGDSDMDSGDSDGDGGSSLPHPDAITSMKCDELPGTLEDQPDDSEDRYAGACVTLDWAENPCTVAVSECPGHLFFDWERVPGGYFNLKFMDGADVVSSTAGTVNPRQPPSTIPASVSNLPEGEDVTVKAIDLDDNRYAITFRRDGDVVTIASIIKMAI